MSEETLLQIAEAIDGVRFDSVQITIHDARVVQIETIQRMRLDAPNAHLIPGGRTDHRSFADQTTGGRRPLETHNGHAPRELVSTR